jgi:molecular chaperone GrpE
VEVVKKMSDESKKKDKDLEADTKEEMAEEEVVEKLVEDSVDVNEKEAGSQTQEEALNVKYMRLMADFQNFKRRTEKEKSDIYAYANEKIISELLNVIDNFERALATDNDGDSFYKGMEMIFNQLLGVLEKAGAKEIKALGEEFNPNFHNAVMTEDSDQYESGRIIEVLQKGYTLNNRVIRPSMVKVAN